MSEIDIEGNFGEVDQPDVSHQNAQLRSGSHITEPLSHEEMVLPQGLNNAIAYAEHLLYVERNARSHPYIWLPIKHLLLDYKMQLLSVKQTTVTDYYIKRINRIIKIK